MTNVPTAISAVTVYPDRARLTRQGSLAVEAGAQRLEVAELPLQLFPESVRASARGTARARLLGVQVQRSFFTETPAEQIRRLEEQVESLQDELKRLDTRVELVNQGRQQLNKLASHTEVYATALAAREMEVDAQLALFDGLRKQSEKLGEEAQSLATLRREIERSLQKVSNDLEQQRSGRPRERNTAYIEVEVIEPGELTVELSYVVGSAGWKPLYDLRLGESGAQSSLEVTYLAQVSQTTSESWDEVALTLSTARPALAHTLPELKPWYISPLVPPVPMRAMPAPMMAPTAKARAHPQPAMLSAMQDAELESPPLEYEAEAVVAQVESSGAAVHYTLPGLANIPPDGAAHKVTIAQFPLVPRLDYVTAPRLAEAAYRRAKVPNDSPYTFLPGEASLFVGEEYLGSTRLGLTAPQGELELYLGTDDRIKVERELKRREADKRLIGGKRRLAFGYEIRVENLLPGQAKVLVQDQLPVSRHEEIKARLESSDPKPAEQTELNILKWVLVLAPKERATLRFDFSVESPQGMDVIGLP